MKVMGSNPVQAWLCYRLYQSCLNIFLCSSNTWSFTYSLVKPLYLTTDSISEQNDPNDFNLRCVSLLLLKGSPPLSYFLEVITWWQFKIFLYIVIGLIYFEAMSARVFFSLGRSCKGSSSTCEKSWLFASKD